jgi:Zinc dependent phospholipase C
MASSTVRCVFMSVPLLFLIPAGASAYSVLTHEAIVDSVWDTTFKPLLLHRYPRATEEQLREAHAYAYGGSIIQDMGYYPFGSKFFSDLVHYVRSGDFVVTMLRDAADLNEFAFALGAMAHYAADNIGHPEGVNIAEPLLYPKLRRKFGDYVTYEDSPGEHMKTEFGFDVLEVARGNFAPKSYHDFIGFKVAKPLLERSFQATYSFPMSEVFDDLDLALGTYRHTVSGLIPKMTKVAWADRKDEIRKANPSITARRFRYNLSRASYEKEWDRTYEKPGIGSRILAFLLKLLPKVGPLRALSFKMPTPKGETVFMRSFNNTLAWLRSFAPAVRAGDLRLDNMNFDIGKPTRQGEYRMADGTYSDLLVTLANKNVRPSEAVRLNIIEFFRDPSRITDPKALAELNALKQQAGN